jgi:hypothetical protein
MQYPISKSIRSALPIMIALAAGFVTRASAQGVDTVVIQRQDILRDGARHNWYVRATGSSTLSGRLRDAIKDTATIGAHRITVADIAQLERRTNVGGGWKAGALMGTGGFGYLGHELAGLCEGDCDGAALGGTLIGAAIGAVLGGVIGQLLVPAKHEWQTVWE